MNEETAHWNQLWSSLIIEELVRNDVTSFGIAPGSRNVPLSTAAAGHPGADCVVHFDERGLAFFMMGLTAATGRPGCLICTSGTAVANFLPAVIEASKKKLPLIILTADRPPELQQTGANQTIEQNGIFRNHVRLFTPMPCPSPEIDPAFVLTTVDQAVARSRHPLPGPVHLNCMFREPLYGAPDTGASGAERHPGLAEWEKQPSPYTRYFLPQKNTAAQDILIIAEAVEQAGTGLIAVGKLKSDTERQAVCRLSEHLQWPVYPDITSGLRLDKQAKTLIPYFHQILLHPQMSSGFRPEGVIQLGGRMTARAWPEFVCRVRPRSVVTVLNHPLRNDPGHCVTHRVEAPVALFCDSLISKLKRREAAPLGKKLIQTSQEIGRLLQEESAGSETFHESAAIRTVLRNLPEKSGLYLGNSLTIREADLSADLSGFQGPIEANRGASGIDGNIASAAGFAKGLNGRTVTAILGDTAALHDLNSLALTAMAGQPLILVVLNNNGGGIFSFLDYADRMPFGVLRRTLTAPHGLAFSGIAETFQCGYFRACSAAELKQDYAQALQTQKTALIECPIDPQHLQHLRLNRHQKIAGLLKDMS